MSDTSQGPGWWLASDGKWYPPQPPAPPPPPPYALPPPPTGAYAGPIGPPPKSGMSGCLKAFLIVLVVSTVVGVGGCIFAVSRVDDVVRDVDFNDTDELNDVDVRGCGRSSSGSLQADLRVTNDSSERSNYLIEVTFEDGAGNQVDTGVANVSALASGQSRDVAVQSNASVTGDIDCRVAGVERFSDEG